MSITDELRGWMKGSTLSSWTAEHLTAIVDRIDAEHQKAIRELNNLADASVLLPVDADGEYIRIGDVMEWCDNGETLTVEGIGNDVLFYIDGENAEWTAARNKRHHHAPTVEDVLREFANEVYADADNEIRDRDFLCAKYAKRLTLTEEEDA